MKKILTVATLGGKMIITYIYGDLTIVMVGARFGDTSPEGTIWVIDDEAARGGYLESLDQRLAVFGMDKKEIENLMDDIELAYLSKQPFTKVYD